MNGVRRRLGRSDVGRMILIVSVLLLFGSGIAEALLVQRFLKAPTSPAPREGLIATYNDHGTQHYISRGEANLQSALVVLPFIAVGGIAAGLYLRRK